MFDKDNGGGDSYDDDCVNGDDRDISPAYRQMSDILSNAHQIMRLHPATCCVFSVPLGMMVRVWKEKMFAKKQSARVALRSYR